MIASTPAACSLARPFLMSLVLIATAYPATAQGLGSLADEYCELIELGQCRTNRVAMDRQYLTLTRMAPSEGILPYTHALLLTDQRRYDDAVRSSARAIKLDRGNLNAWKLHIWLQLQNEQFAPALKTVAKLAECMPGESATGVRRERGERMAEYFGTVVGYVAYPRQGELPRYDLVEHARDIRTAMTSGQHAAFERGRDRVKATFAAKAQRINHASQLAYGADLDSRQSQLDQMAGERARIQDELDRIEGLRLEGKAIAASERNTLAATRESFLSGSASYAAEDGVSRTNRRELGLGLGTGGIGVGASRTRNVTRYDNDYAASSFAAGSKGFGRNEYQSVGKRDRDYDKHLTKRADSLLRQLQVMERKEVALRKQTANGSSSRVARMKRNAKRLTAYMALPVDPQTETTELLAKLDRYAPSGHSIALALQP